MILQELVHYYDRAGDLATEGWEWKRIPYVIDIRADGSFIQLTSLRSGAKSADVKPSLVPKSENRQGTKAYEKPNLLWDHHGFVLAHPKSDNPKDVLAAQRQHEHFVRRVEALIASGTDDPGLQAVSRFLASDAREKVREDPLWSECAKVAGCNLAFRLAGDDVLVVQRDAVREAIDRQNQAGTDTVSGATGQSRCLVTGELALIQALHSPIAGVCEKPSPMAAVNDGVSPAYSSFGKSQGFNFPVGETAVFKYTTALNRLLQPGSRQRLKIGDTAVIFWSQSAEDADVENSFAALFDEVPDDPNAHTDQVRSLYSSIQSGRFDGAAGDRRFFVLGLAPNSARIVVRFWQPASLRDIAYRVRQWFDDLSLVHGPKDSPHPALYHLLRSVALKGDAKNVPPSLGGDVMRAILSGGPFPALWLNAAVQRCRAERHVSYLRACAIKACLNRAIRFQNPTSEEVYRPMLDLNNMNAGYRLGRLFATLEKIQEAASPGLNATIRERYFGAASSTPVAVFTTLLRLKNHHLAKLPKELAIHFEKLIAEIVGGIDDFPAHMALPDQGRFALGYYHQRQAFFTKRAAESTETASTQGEPA